VIPVVEGYDRWAPAYDAFDNPMVALASMAFAQANLPLAGSAVLDVGCGTGRNLVLAAAAGAKTLVGLDASPGMLANARAKLGATAHLLETDLASAWPPLPGPFDVACVSLVLEHFKEVAPVVAQIAAHLNSGGVLFVAEMHADLAANGTGAHFEKDGKRHVLPSHGHSQTEFVAALAASGFAPAIFKDWRADDCVGQIPKLAKHAGKNALLSFIARLA
jgi:SAM-dependent methyltransferase